MTTRILVVEDEPLLNQTLVRLLLPFGPVAPMVYVHEALLALKCGRFDLVIADYNLPDGLGLTVLAAARAALSTTKRILISGNDALDLVELVRLGVVDRAIRKPFSAADLREAVASVLVEP
jgi:CheY-like chemotaxis protein